MGLRVDLIKRIGVDIGGSSRYFEPTLERGGFDRPLTFSRRHLKPEIRDLTFKGLQGRMNLLTLESAKALKSFDSPYLVAMLYLLPHDLGGGRTLCPFSTSVCRFLCLNTSGRGEMGVSYNLNLNTLAIERLKRNVVLGARLLRTRLYRLAEKYDQYEDAFLGMIAEDIETLIIWTGARGKKPAIRLNGTSDIPWERKYPQFFTDFSEIQFYDYTKWPLDQRGERVESRHGTIYGVLPKNYHLTYSISESPKVTNRLEGKLYERFFSSHELAVYYLRNGRNVAGVFWDLPKAWHGFPVIDGTATDLRFLDPPGTVCGLLPLGRAKKDKSGFVMDPNSPLVRPECVRCSLSDPNLNVNVYEGAGPIPRGFPTVDKMLKINRRKLEKMGLWPGKRGQK